MEGFSRILDLKNDGMDSGRLLCWMLFPNESEMRDSYLANEIAKTLTKNLPQKSDVTVPVWVVKDLMKGAGLKELAYRAAEATKLGSVAGDLLGIVYEMHVLGDKEPSLRKAIARYKNFSLGKTYGDGEPTKYSSETLRKYFEAFKPVSHFWAAYRLNRDYPFLEDFSEMLHSEKGLKIFLGVAKNIGNFGVNFIPKRTKPPKPLLDGSSLVKIPDNIPSLTLKIQRAALV